MHDCRHEKYVCKWSQFSYHQKNHFATFDFFCKNEACVNCGTLNATTLIWLLSARIGYLSLIFKQETWQGYLLQRNLDRLIDTR